MEVSAKFIQSASLLACKTCGCHIWPHEHYWRLTAGRGFSSHCHRCPPKHPGVGEPCGFTVPRVPRPAVYIGGPMRGKRFFNFQAFDAARDRLEALGFAVYSPADHDRELGFDPWKLPNDWDWNTTPPGFDLGAALCWCAEAVRKSWGVYLLTGWESSRGATWERDLASMLGKPMFYQEQGQ